MCDEKILPGTLCRFDNKVYEMQPDGLWKIVIDLNDPVQEKNLLEYLEVHLGNLK